MSPTPALESPESAPIRSSIARFALDQRVLMNLLFFVLMLGGAAVIDRMPVDVYPDVDLDEATIDTFWPGASAEDVERVVTDRIEEEIEDIRGISRVLSESKSDASLIRVKWREDLSANELDAAFRQLRAAVERITDLPTDAEKPLITRISVGELFPLLWVAVVDNGNLGENVLHDVIVKLKPVLRDIQGVAKVDDKLIREREIHVRVKREQLAKHGLTLDEVAAVLAQYNRNIPSGTLTERQGEIGVRAVGEVLTPEQLGDIAVRKHASGAHVYLSDVADIEPAFERKSFFARFNGHDCKALGVAKTVEADSRLVAQRVYDTIAEFRKTLPDGIALDICDDSSVIIKSRVRILVTNLVTGIGLVLISLWVAMGIRNALLAIIGIPFSFLCALIFLSLLDVTINAVSLFALVLCSGMIVDDAIVVLENIYRHIEKGGQSPGGDAEKRLHRAIIDGTTEVMWPVMSSSATTVVAFLPLLIMTGVTGKFFAIIPKTVAVVLLASLFECLLIVPVHYHTIGPRRQVRSLWERITSRSSATDRPATPAMSLLMRLYDRLIAGVLRYRYMAPLPLLAMAFLAYAYSGFLKVDLFPSDFQLLVADIKAWDEASLDQTGEVVAPIERAVAELGPQYVKSVLTAYGLIATDDNAALWRNNIAQLHIQLAATDEVAADPTEVAAKVRDVIQKYVDAHPDSGVNSFKVWAPQDGPPIGKPVAIKIQTPDLAAAKRLAERYKQSLAALPGVSGINDNLDFGSRQMNLRLKENIASAHGLSQADLARTLRTANDGTVVSVFKDNRTGEDLDVRVMLDADDRRDLNDLLAVQVRTPRGYLLELGDICEMDMSQSYASIPHLNGKRTLTVTAEVDTGVASVQQVNAAIEREFDPVLAGRSDVRVVYGGEYNETTRSFTSLKRAYLIALVVIYMLLAAQFRSYAQPFVIVAAVPFACIGVVGGLLMDDYPFTIMTAIAMVGLTGVVVNDSIVLIDFVNRRLNNGAAIAEALHDACRTRARPIILTTLTTVLGLLPLAMGWGGRSKIWSPFASSFAWGLTFATLVTLVVVPAFYHITYDLVSVARRWRPERPEPYRSPASANQPAK